MRERTCIIVPCYNEADRLHKSDFLEFLEKHPLFDLCFVNDGSTDSTLAHVEEFATMINDRIFVVDCKENGGKAEAVRQGVMAKQNQYMWMGWADADLATPLEELSRLGELVRKENLLLALGSRIETEQSNINRRVFRHYTGRIFANVISRLFHLDIHDTQCGAKVFNCSIAQIAFQEPFISKWLFDVEVLLRIKLSTGDFNTVVREVPLNIWTEKGGSKIRVSDLLRMPRQLLAIYRKYRLSTHKLQSNV